MKKLSTNTWMCIFSICLIIHMLITHIQFINLNNKILELDYNQKLTLRQVQINELDINKVDKEVNKIIEKYSLKYGVDKNLVKAISIVESGGKHYKNEKQDVKTSPAGAIGIMQLTPQTAKNMNVNPYSLDENIKGATKYLAYLDKKFKGNTDLVISAYNTGEGNVTKHGGVPSYTRGYINKVKKEKAKLDDKNN